MFYFLLFLINFVDVCPSLVSFLAARRSVSHHHAHVINTIFAVILEEVLLGVEELLGATFDEE